MSVTIDTSKMLPKNQQIDLNVESMRERNLIHSAAQRNRIRDDIEVIQTRNLIREAVQRNRIREDMISMERRLAGQ